MPCRSRNNATSLAFAFAAAVLAAGAVRGDDASLEVAASTSPLRGDTRVLLLPTVNGTERAVALLARDAAGGYLVDEQTLTDWSIAPPYPPPVEIGGREFYPLDRFAGLNVAVDERSMSAVVNVPPEILTGTRRSLAGHQTPITPQRAFGAYLDYDVAYLDDDADGDSAGLSSLLNPTLFTAQGTLTAGMLYEGQALRVPGASRGFTRLDTTWTRDDPSAMRTLRVGDAVTPYGSWGRSLRFGGVQFGTNFATRPEEITFPQPTIEGTAAVASALDIFVNGSLSSRTEVPSGAFQIDNVPIVTGAGQIQVVTRDLMGREQIVTQDFYVSERLLRRGLNEYSVSAGAVRDDYGIASSEYGDFLVAGVFRRGLSDSLTLEGRVEGTADAQAAGVSVARAMGLYGITSAAVAISQGTRSGSLWQLGHEYQGRVFRASMRVQGSRRFAQPGFSLLAGWPELQIVASGGRGFGRKGSLGASYVEERFADAANDRKIVTLTYSRSLSRTFVLAASASQISARNGGSAATITVNRALGPRSSASATAYARNGDTTLRLDHRYELPAGPGFGYRTSFSEGAERRRAAEVAVNTKHARYYVEGAQYGDALGWRLGTRGSVAILDGDMFAAREINDGFAVVDAGGFEGVRVYLENREIGTTDRHGRLLVPSLRPYESNRLRIEAADLPLTARIDDSGMQVAPYYRSGALARFGIEDGSSVLVRVVTDDGLPVAEGARARVGDGPFDYPVGLDGRLYLQAGHGAHVEIANGGELLCSLALPEVYDQSQGIPDLGEVVCR